MHMYQEIVNIHILVVCAQNVVSNRTAPTESQMWNVLIGSRKYIIIILYGDCLSPHADISSSRRKKRQDIQIEWSLETRSKYLHGKTRENEAHIFKKKGLNAAIFTIVAQCDQYLNSLMRPSIDVWWDL